MVTTLVHHVCEKPDDIHIPSVSDVYQQILAANKGKYAEVLLLPEYGTHEDWETELDWIADNFGGQNGIPIMLDVFGGGPYSYPVPQLTTQQIQDAMAVANVKWLRFAEVISWHIEHEQPFPTEYMGGILSFCRANNLKLFWCEWKIDYIPGNVLIFKAIQQYITGFEDIVYAGFKTNSGDLEPEAGFSYIKNLFLHWGGVVESWYWETRHRGPQYPPELNNPDNMPISWMICHANQAKDLGAEIIQFEPYWYFFSKDDGKAKSSLATLHTYLNGASACMEPSAVVLQTLRAEWLLDKPAKADIEWLSGKADVGWYMQPSTYDFAKMPKEYAVSCYSLGTANPSERLWLKTEIIAVEVLVKCTGITLEQAKLMRDTMICEVERVLYIYSKVAPLWDPNPGPTGTYKHRRVPSLQDVVVGQQGERVDTSTYCRATIQVRCKVYPKKTWVTGVN